MLAYSGGLDTSFLVPWVAENTGRPVITVTVDTGGIDAAAARTLAERVMQAQTIARMARQLGTNMIAHGCTAAGNDQVRFEVALRTLAPELEIIAPVRDRTFKRADELRYLQDRKLPIPPTGAAYSINRGLWGVTIGGTETLTSKGSIPESAWV
ncbi:MAG TPA: argininosuccinate synthase domain-containing protein, partial [Steroidobacteraceae bacterium]|nr:argininosuccinate synthase domain-containing protein [Steroidobacteraceae bacterium]